MMKKRICFMVMLLMYALYSYVTRMAVGYGGVVAVTATICWIAFTMPVLTVVVDVIAAKLFP